jgi:hypothetical protein
LRLGALHNLKERPPKLLTRVSYPILVEKTKPLAGGASDYHIGLGDLDVWIFQEINDVSRMAMIVEVPIVCVHRKLIDVVGPYRLKPMAEVLAETKCETACPREQVDEFE